jgi:peroxiredoxin (alkyl hydroperoxide reductase subunit C)
MIRIGQKIDDFVFDSYQGDEIRKIKLSNYKGKWLVLLLYPVDFDSTRPAELEEAAACYDRFRKGGAEILTVCMKTASRQGTRHEGSPSMKRIAFPIAANSWAKLCRHFEIYVEDTGMSLRHTFIIDPDGVLRARTIKRRAAGDDEIFKREMGSHSKRGEIAPWKLRMRPLQWKRSMALTGSLRNRERD